MEETILSKNSVAQIIQNSHEFTYWFKQEVHNVGDAAGGNVANLHAAKHRFETYSKPLGRFILHLVAVLRTVARIAIERSDERAGWHAKAWLKGVNGEKLLQLAMLADAGDEGLCLVRFCDDENVDPAELQTHVGDFVDRLQLLFTHKEVPKLMTVTIIRMAMMNYRTITYSARPNLEWARNGQLETRLQPSWQ